MTINFRKLKYTVFFFLYLLFSVKTFSQADSTFTIIGHLNGQVNDQWVWFQNADDEQFRLDSVKTIAGNFSFKGRVKSPSLYNLKIGKSSKETFPFFVENTKIDLNCEYIYPFSCEVKGSYNQLLIDEFAIKEKMAWNPIVIEKLKETYANYNEKAGYIRKQKFSETIKTYASLHANDKAIAYLTSLNSNYILDEELELIYNNFGPNLKYSIFTREIKTEIELRNATKIGKKLTDIKQTDLNGEKVSLWDFQGKYVLLYFWASNFEPCRKENQKLKKLYEKYKPWDFEIMAVSMDTEPEAWTRAIMEYGLNWQNLSDLKGWDNEIAKKLKIQTIPYTLLLDREGVIIGRDLRAEEIDNILNLIKATSTAAANNNQTPSKKESFFKKKFLKKKRNGGVLPGASN